MHAFFHGNIRPSGYVPAFRSTQPIEIREEITGIATDGADADKETRTEENTQMLEATS